MSLVQDWTHLGNTTYIVGDIFDAQYTTERVLGNDTVISATLITSEGLPFDLANGMLNNSTGEFNLSVVMPTNLPSNAYFAAINFDFESMAPLGGAASVLLILQFRQIRLLSLHSKLELNPNLLLNQNEIQLILFLEMKSTSMLQCWMLPINQTFLE